MSKIIMKTPDNLEELIECLKNADENTGLISGGTDFVIQLRQKKLYSGTIVDLSRIRDFRYIREDGDLIRIGATSTLTEISENELVKKYLPSLAEAAGQVGSTQIRNRGTIAGNIGNSSPCADTVPPLMSVDARLKVVNGEGKISERTLDEVIFGSGRNNLKFNEAIIEIVFPKLADGYISAFTKLGTRKAVTISKINGAVVLKYNSYDNLIEEARVFVGALGPKAFRSEIAEKVLINKTPSEKLFREFSDALTEQVDISIAGRNSQAYKREAIKGVAHDIFYKLFGNVVSGGDR
ncbi:FAD binding domain-containing protein [Wukongibacter sp. M2B1]|uniref:FAD binding domain-containing protein n=1 Tax=Wukongibacter sp. M2B1 TaxID=3088895 RepID=UPI003D792678